MLNRQFISGLLLLPPLLVTGVFATADVNPNGPNPLALEEVIVTANRREQSIQEVPMSVTAFTGQFFKESGVTNLAGLEQYTPSLKITPGTDSNSTSIRIRGIGSVGTNAGIDPSVGVFIDGVYQGRAGMSIGDLIDIERVEILRGPQGTLYGKNTAAGAISIITKAPSAQAFESEIELTYNTDQRAEVHAMINVPFGDTGNAMRLTGFAVNGDHLYKNTYDGQGLNDANKWGLKARTLFDTGAKADGDGFGEFLFTFDYMKEDTDCCALAIIDYTGLSTLNSPSTNTPSAQLSAALGLNAQGNPILQWNSFEDSEGFPPPMADPFNDDYWIDTEIRNKVEVGGAAMEWNKELSNENIVTFINAWRHYESDSGYDGDFTAYDAVAGSTDINFDQYSSELRITSAGGETIDYQAGLYAFYSEMDSVGTFSQSVALVTNIGIAALFPDGTLNTDTNQYKTTSYAAFGQAIWNITDTFSTTLGLRYTYERKDRKGSQITSPASILDIPPVAGPDVYYDDSRNDDNISPALIARYFATPEIMTYASISRGFKSGGFNQRRELEGKNGEFDEETATNYEIGWKASSEDRSLQLNGTFYYTSYDDFQAQAFDGSSISVTNAGSMESYGLELDIVYVPIADVVVGSAVGYNKAEYKDFDNGQCTVAQAFNQYYVTEDAQGGSPGTLSLCLQDLAGKALDNVPEWTVSSYANYERDLTADLVGTARLEYNYIDSFFLDQDLDKNLQNDAVHLVNLRFTLSNVEQTWNAAIWGRNLLNEDYYAFGLDVPVLGGYAGVTAPDAIYGVTVRFMY
ncbi:MAG: TonB-dependent receptor [Halioglobus sp.]|nr:TonB-dependent receptor [Halioglobus sp.]